LSTTAGDTAGSYRLDGSRNIPVLGIDQTSTGTVTVKVASGVPDGTYYLLACADDKGAVAEGHPGSRCKASAETTVVVK
jgi:hypothetical protein